MSIIPSIFGQRTNVFDPFSLDIWDQFQDFLLNNNALTCSNLGMETSAFANARIEWKETLEAHVFYKPPDDLKEKEEEKGQRPGLLSTRGTPLPKLVQLLDKGWVNKEEEGEQGDVEIRHGSILALLLRCMVPRPGCGQLVPLLKLANTIAELNEKAPHIFKADLPGLKKEELKVEMKEGRVLQISGETSREKEDKNDKWHCIERRSGKFQRKFRLPENAKVGEVKASMENGVLTVTVPKEQVKKPDDKAIDISG